MPGGSTKAAVKSNRSAGRGLSYPAVWAAVRHIPRGRVASYGTIARLAGRPRHARFVGYALRAIPAGLDVPWHRVVGSGGRILLPGDSGIKQRMLLEREGIRFERGRVNVSVYGWPVRRPSR